MRPRSRAFVLLELLVVLVLLAAFSLVSARLFASLMRQLRVARAQQVAAGRFDAAVARMREDVWTADQIQAQQGTLVLTRRGGGGGGQHIVTWLAAQDGSVARTETDTGMVTGLQRWGGLTAKLSFATDGRSACWVRVEDKGGVDTVAMVSQAGVLRPAQQQEGTP